MTGGQASKARLWLRRAVQAALLAGVCFFVVRGIARNLASVSWQELHVAPGMLLASVLLLAGSFTLSATAFRSTLATVSVRPRWRTMLGATWLSRMGKYVPGKVLTVAGLAYVLQRYGVDGRLAAGMVLVNTGLNVTLGFLLACPLLLWEPVRDKLPFAPILLVAAVAASAVAVHPRVYFPIIDWMLKRLGRTPLGVRPRLASYLSPLAHLLAQWVLIGASLWCLAASMGQVPLAAMWQCIAISALAVTGGFVVLFAPAGLGVRDGIYLLTLTPLLGSPERAALVTVATRLLHTLVEVGLAALGLALLRLESRANAEGKR